MFDRILIVALLSLLIPQTSQADCIDLTSGSVDYEVTGCEEVVPEALFPTAEARDRFFKEFSPLQSKQIMTSYMGLMLEGKIVGSKAIAKGAKTRQHSLLGKTESMFVGQPPVRQCSALVGKRITGIVRQNCCDGHLEVPCLTKTSYVLTIKTPRPSPTKASKNRR